MLERVERCLAMAAFYVLREGHELAPILDAMENEAERARLEAARNRIEQPAERARRILENYKRSTDAPRRLAITRP